ncbi:MAG: glycosyltransferase family 2 protein [Thiotrichaceae bacterium]|nr:glycosyltransferase family 2 protein [Thiotrichaceae bacterium]PCI13950.1 MAG: glycosyltransferase [Thiotrichales bacterium]
MKIIALATSYNRKDITLRALESLHRQSLPPDFEMSICIVDDGSTDGTGEAVRSIYPKVILLEGGGELFWAGGMRFGWDHYVKHQEFDYLLVFNDDIELYPEAITKLLAVGDIMDKGGCRSYAVTGALVDPCTMEVAYGGVVRDSTWHPLRVKMITPSDRIQECDTLNMNCALISREAFALTGFLSSAFRHKRADFDFGLRLKRAGGKIVLASGYVGQCFRNDVTGSSKEPGISPVERWQRLIGVKEEPFQERAIYCREHSDWRWPIFWSTPYLRVWIDWIIQLSRGRR